MLSFERKGLAQKEPLIRGHCFGANSAIVFVQLLCSELSERNRRNKRLLFVRHWKKGWSLLRTTKALYCNSAMHLIIANG